MLDLSPEMADEFKELLFALENTERGGWFFVVYKQWKVAEALTQRLRDSSKLPLFSWQYQPKQPTYPVDYLKNLNPEQKTQRAIVLLSHVTSGGQKVIKSLDFNRERFADYPHCLLFWVTESELKEIAIGAGHFWAQRGGRFDFTRIFIPEEQAQAPATYSEWEGALLHIENAKEAEEQLPFYLNALQEQQDGAENIALIELYDKVCVLLFYLGRYEETISYKQKALAIEERLFGDNDIKLTKGLNNLGVAYHHQGRYDEALPLTQRALIIRKKVLGEQHPDVASSLNNLALLYQDQGRYDEALPLYQRSLAIRENVLGEQHPDVADSLNNLALLHYEQEHYDEALPLYQKSLAIREKILGEQHPDVANSLNNLASLYQEQGRYDKALPLYQRALAIREKVLGEQHPYVATSLNNLAMLYCKQEHYYKTLPVFKRALAILKKTLGKKHPNTKKIAQNYATTKRLANQSPSRRKKNPSRRSK